MHRFLYRLTLCTLLTFPSFGWSFTLACLGDSNTASITAPVAPLVPSWCDILATRHPEWTIVNTGHSGGFVTAVALPGAVGSEYDAFVHWDRAAPSHPDVVVLAYGTNDLFWFPHGIDFILTQFQVLHDRITETGAAVLVATAPPRLGARVPEAFRLFNRAIRHVFPPAINFDRGFPTRHLDASGVHWDTWGQEHRATQVERTLRRLKIPA